jgi:DNA gyrase subunit A
MISVLGRNTSGVKVMNLEEGIKVASFTKVKNDDSQNEEVDSSESGTEELSEDVPDETDDVETGEIETDNVDSEDEVPSEDTVE